MAGSSATPGGVAAAVAGIATAAAASGAGGAIRRGAVAASGGEHAAARDAQDNHAVQARNERLAKRTRGPVFFIRSLELHR
jgi:hypothetical protein